MTPSEIGDAVAGDLSFLERMVRSALGILEGLADRMPYLVVALVFLLVTWVLSRLTGRIVRAALGRTSTEGHVDVLLGRMAAGTVFVVGIVVSLGILGLQVSALVTSLGLAGVTIGFALKDVLANSMAGIMLLLQRPFTIGDRVSVAGCDGVVRDIRVRDTLIEQADGRMVYVPNATVFNEPIVNTSSALRRRVDVRVRVPLATDLDAARDAALAGLRHVPGLVPEAPVEALYVATGIASATLSARAWVDTADVPFAKATDAAIRGVSASLRAAGVETASAE